MTEEKEKNNETTLTDFWAALGKSAGLSLIMVAQITWNGFVITILWGWFVVPHFGVAPLNIPTAIGLGMVALLFSRGQILLEDEYQKSLIMRKAYNFFEPALLLLIGWIATWFI